MVGVALLALLALAIYVYCKAGDDDDDWGHVRMRAKKWWGGRSLLNKPGYQSTAAIVAEIENTEHYTDDDWQRPRYTLQFANCDRSISFELDLYDKEARANSLFKVKTMARLLAEFQEGLEQEIKRIEQRERARKRRSR